MLISQQSIDFLDKIQIEFGKNYSEELYAEFNGRLAGYSRAVLDAAHQEIVRTCERLPTFAAIDKAIKVAISANAPKQQIDPIAEKKKKFEDLVTRWSNEYQKSHLNARAIREGIEWPIYKYARSMAETQAWMILGAAAPGYDDFDGSAVSNREEYERRKDWYLDFCSSQAQTGRIEVIISDYVFKYYASRLQG